MDKTLTINSPLVKIQNIKKNCTSYPHPIRVQIQRIELHLYLWIKLANTTRLSTNTNDHLVEKDMISSG